jgi:glycosyltransferase involved in cell wall biosynthesis
MTALPKISIVVPTYQQGHFIERTLLSILSQGYPNLELIVIDGGSTDATREIVERHRAHIAVFVSEKDKGQTDAIAKGFARATGEVITWMNSDDTYAPDALRTVGQFFADHPQHGFVYGNRDIIDEDDKVIARRRQPDFHLGVMLYAHMIVPQVAAFWRRSLYDQVGGMDVALRFCMDHDLFIRLAQASTPVHLPQVLGNFRIHGDSKTSTLEHVRQAEDRLVQNRYCRFKPDSRMFQLARKYYTCVLVLNMARNGGLWERIRGSFGSRIKGNIRVYQ